MNQNLEDTSSFQKKIYRFNCKNYKHTAGKCMNPRDFSRCLKNFSKINPNKEKGEHNKSKL